MCEMSSRDLAPQRVVSKITYNVIELTKAYHGSLLTYTYNIHTYVHTYIHAYMLLSEQFMLVVNLSHV